MADAEADAGLNMSRPVDIIRKAAPRARPEYVSAFDNGDGLFKQYGITTPLRLAHFLAQCLHETDGLTITYESGNYSAARIIEIFGVGHHSAAVTQAEAQKLAHDGPALFERVYGLGNPKKARELGNTQAGDGWKYRGTGILQSTGRGAARQWGQKCGVDFENHPELMLSAEHALKPPLFEWSAGNLNAAADRDDIVAITRRINGGLNGLDSRRAWFAKVRPLIASVELQPTPIPAPAPAPAPAKPVPPAQKAKATGGVVVATGGAAAVAHSSGLSPSAIIAIVIAGLVIAAGVFFWLHRKNKPPLAPPPTAQGPIP